MTIKTRVYVAAALLLLSPLVTGAAERQPDYPARPIRFVVPFAPGGSSDIQARIIAQKMSEHWRTTVIIDNRPSAGGIAACEIVATAGADGYTLLLGHVGTHAYAPALYKSLPYDTRSFAPVTMTLTQPLVMVVPMSSPFRTVQNLLDASREKSSRLNYASAGIGSPNHLAAELFKSMAGAQLEHVPYKGAVPAELDTMTGRVDLFFDSMLSAAPLIRSKKLQAIAVTGARRSNVVPDVPTVAESGVRGYEMQTWNGVFVPNGTPPSIVAMLNAEIVSVLRMQDVKAKLEGDGAQLVGDSSDQFGRYVEAERRKWGRVIQAAKIQAQ
jgi:tripartite-type tricarboxylate transporter receptor subunit TctC